MPRDSNQNGRGQHGVRASNAPQSKKEGSANDASRTFERTQNPEMKCTTQHTAHSTRHHQSRTRPSSTTRPPQCEHSVNSHRSGHNNCPRICHPGSPSSVPCSTNKAITSTANQILMFMKIDCEADRSFVIKRKLLAETSRWDSN